MTQSLGENIKIAREAAGLTQEQLGAMVGVTGVAIMRYEKGQREPRSGTLLKIAKALNVDVYSLADFDTATKLLDRSINGGDPSADSSEIDDPGLEEILEQMKNRSEMRMLFKLATNASAEDVRRAINIIEALRKEE